MTKPELSGSDYAQVARLHVNYIEKGFLSSLGIGFLSLLYQSIEESPKGALFVHREGDKIVGFVSASDGMKPIYLQLLKHLFTLVRVLFPVLLSPGKLRKIAELLLRPSSHESNADYRDSPELLSIVVDAQYHGKGVAQKLYGMLRSHYAKLDKQGFLIVVGKDLHAAHKFYLRCGATAIGEVQIHSGEDSVLYWQALSPVGEG